MGRSRSQMVSSSKVGQLQHQAVTRPVQHCRNVPAGDTLENFEFAAPRPHASLGASARQTSNHLEIPSQQTSLSMMSQMNPIADFYHNSEGPYMVGSRTNVGICQYPNEASQARLFVQSNPDVNYHSYPKRPHSDIGSAVSGQYRHSDSGYCGSAAVPSERSFNASYFEENAGSTQPLLSQSTQFQSSNFDVPAQPPIQSQVKPTKTVKRKKVLPPCTICGVVPTCPSDKK